MNNIYKSTKIITGFILLFTMIFFSCNSNTNSKKEMTTKSLKQEKNDLLAGISRAVCYSGFRSGQHPNRGEGAVNPSDEQILEDLQIISSDSLFMLIRLYDCGENSQSVLKIINENNLNIKVMLGIWLRAELSNHLSCAWLTEPIPQEVLNNNKLINSYEIQQGILLANEYPEIIVAVNVGNESLVDWNDHKVNTDTVISYVQRVKKAIKQDVTVADNYEWWATKGKKLASQLDFISIHVYPLWEGKDIDEAMSYSIENIQRVHDSLPESKIVISEAGWATVASEFGDRANEEKQTQYFNQLLEYSEEMNITTFFFEAFDEDWKGNSDNMMGAEKHWGLYTVDRKPKKVMQDLFLKKTN